MADSYLTNDMLASESLMLLENMTPLAKTCYVDLKTDLASAPKKGGTINIRMPVQTLYGEQEDVSSLMQEIVERKRQLTVNGYAVIPWQYSLKDLTLSIEDYSRLHLRPAVAQIANVLESSIAACYKQIANATGDCTPPNSYDDLATAGTILTELGVPQDDRHIMLAPAAKQSVTGTLATSYNEALVKAAYAQNKIPSELVSMVPGESQNIYTHTSNTQTTVTVNTTLTKDSTTTDTTGPSGGALGINQIKLDGLDGDPVEGDLFTVAGVYSVNPMNRRSTGRLQSFRVTAAVSYTGSADVVTFDPVIIMSDGDYPQYQNVSAYPVSGAAVTFKASHVANMVYHRQAIGLAIIPLEMPWGGNASRADSKVSGLSIRVWRDSDIRTGKNIIRLDAMWAVKAVYPELACRLCG